MKLSHLFGWLAALIVLLVVLSIIFAVPQTQQMQGNTLYESQLQNGVRTPPPPPPMTASDTIAAQQGNVFQLLVSYTDTGFEPRTATIKAGDTVRFTNNSSGQLWVAASGDTLYPSVQNGCGSSALDSCQALTPGEFWEFTFTQAGTWEFDNNLNKSDAGTLIVR